MSSTISSLGTPYFNIYPEAVAIIPSATLNIDGTTIAVNSYHAKWYAVYVGGAGVVSGVTEFGQTISITAPAGTVLPIAFVQILATSTATLMVGLR